MVIKRYETLYVPLEDKGKVVEKGREDWLFSNPYSSFHMVYDGASPRDPEGNKVFLGDQTVSWHCGRIVAETCSSAPRNLTPRGLLLAANEFVAEWQQGERRANLKESENLGGGTVAVVKIEGDRLLIAWAGDCAVVVAKKSGDLWATTNHLYDTDMQEMAIVDSLMKKHRGDRDAMWKDFSPVVQENRRRYINKKVPGGFGVLNGQPEFKDMVEEQEFSLDEVAAVLLFTDGATSLEDSRDPQILAKKTWDRYLRGGLRGIMQEARAEKDPDASYVSYDEATLIGIEFA